MYWNSVLLAETWGCLQETAASMNAQWWESRRSVLMHLQLPCRDLAHAAKLPWLLIIANSRQEAP